MNKSIWLIFIGLQIRCVISTQLDFQCLDGSKTISFNFVNDDYCDCPDGSDETNTSACPNGKFQCANTGYKSKTIPSSRVNDGICDCCDGSDEPPHVCVNLCVDLFQQEEQERQLRLQIHTQGVLLRQQYAQNAVKIKIDREQELMKIEAELSEVINKEVVANDEKKEIEAKETVLKDKYQEALRKKNEEIEELKKQACEAAFKTLDLDNDGSLTSLEISTQKSKLDLQRFENISSFNFHDCPDIKETWMIYFKEYVLPTNEENSNIKEENIVEEVTANEVDTKQVETGESDADEKAAGEVFNSDEFDDDDDDEDYEEDAEIENETVEEDPSDNPNYDSETLEVIKQATEKRKIHAEIVKQKREMERKIGDLKEKIDFDFGPDLAFQALEGECFELKTLEYEYKLCPFEKSTQMPLRGGSPTSLGTWSRWDGGDNNDKYSKMKYDGGDGCWNGPQRSTDVVLSCGKENKLLSVDEPSRCCYLFHFNTPCACDPSINSQNSSHDEL